MELTIVTIPHGIPINGSWLRQVGLRELNGYDEQLLAEASNYPLPFRTTALLERVIKFGNGTVESSNTEIIRRLTEGDRIALILHIRRMTFGDKLQCVLSCSNCKEGISLDLSILDLLQPSIPDPSSEYVVNVENFTLKIRPVTGADLEYLFDNGDESNTVEQLMRSCIISSDPPLPEKLTDDFIATISSRLEELDPQADLVLDMVCPACQHSFQTPFNAEDFIFGEISTRQSQLEREVHWLAFNYHWSEDSILSLPLKKRKRYVDLINRTLSGESV